MKVSKNKLMARMQAGFTLVELMIVVAIIGILASIAVPNYQKYQAKSRTTEAKIYLAGIYTAEKSFLIEYSSYTSCIAAAGFSPEGGNRYYTVGVNADAAANDAGPIGTGDSNGTAWGNGAPTCTIPTSTNPFSGTNTAFVANAKISAVATIPVAASLPGADVRQAVFTIGAVGAIHPSASTLDTWTINESKVIQQTVVGY